MSLEIRRIRSEEGEAFVRAQGTGFGSRRSQETVATLNAALVGYTCRAAFDGSQIVATLVDYVADIALPGGVLRPALLVTWVSTLPTHRRRGAMRGLMDAALADAREAGIPFSFLWASETAIYGRFGFAPAMPILSKIVLDTRHAATARPFTDPGRVRFAEPADARRVVPEMHARTLPERPGDVATRADDWDYVLSDEELKERFVVVHEDADGVVDGFAIYRFEQHWEDGVPESTVDVEQLTWSGAAAHAALWCYLAGIDLVRTVRVHDRPVDDPLRWLLADPRRARMGPVNDGVWANLHDVPAALEQRGYLSDGTVVFDCEGAVIALEARDGAGHASATAAGADLVLDRRALASCFLGGVRFAELAAAGIVGERSPGAAARADRLFQPERAPWCTTVF